jgi:thiol-disulfide isomerase/thioredoxin
VYRPRNNDVVSVDPIVARTAGDKLNPSLRALLAEQNPSLLLAIVPDASAELTAGALRVTTQSTGELAGCVGLRIERADENLNAAFDATTHLLRQMRVDLTPGLRGADFPKGGHVELRFDYTRDEAQKQIAASEVAWSPPAEAQAYRPAPSVETGDGSEAASKLEGNPAPAFSLKDAENKRVSLADFKGSVVVLDFWAVWCGPCRAALPHLDQLSKQKAGAGVKVLAIDEQDAPEAAMAYVSQAKLGLHVAFDADGAVGKTYMVEGIPETVVIGKDGVVRKVVVGYGPGDDRVEKAVDNALAE